MRNPGPPAIILGGAANAVSVARSLAAAGASVYALGTGRRDPVRRSRSCTAYVAVEAPSGAQASWLAWLEGSRRQVSGAAILPCDDDGLELIVANRDRLLELGYRPFEADDDVARAMLDKSATYALAHQVGVPAPRAVALRCEADLRAAVDEIGFPCALKPIRSHVFSRRFRKGKGFLVRDPGELSRVLAAVDGTGAEMLMTEVVPGGDDRLASYYTYLDQDGDPLFHFTKRKLRQFPTTFGAACYEVTAWDAEVAELGLRFLQRIGLRGLAIVEFKRDASDGRLVLIECNHRFTASSELVRLSGIDLALVVYHRLVGRDGPAVGPYRGGVYLWQPIEDVRAFLSLRRHGEITLGRWLRSLCHPQHFPVFRWDDPGPTLTTVDRALDLVRRRAGHRRLHRRP